MATWIVINQCITFAPNLGVLVDEEALDFPAHEIKEMLALAYKHMNDEPLRQACHGGCGPLADLGTIDYEEYLVRLKDALVAEATLDAKRGYTKVRRAEYSARHSQLALALIESGAPHICAHPNCEKTEELTLDHVVPLSRGGTDELTNLQFLCRAHNSSKGAKLNV